MAEMDMIGNKRKYKENAFTAKAETGTLKVKIMRKDNGRAAAAASAVGGFGAATHTAQPTHIEVHRSPPKPRPNRKHVPIFYQQRTTSTFESSTSSTDESVAAVSQTMSVASDDLSGGDTNSSHQQQHVDAAPGSYSNRFSSLLSGLRLDSSGTNTTGLPRPQPPATNPLFSRTDSDGATSALFGDVLRHAFPSGQGVAVPSLSSFAGPPTNGATALHQLATSAANNSSSSVPTQTSQSYRFNPFTALQSAIDVHQATLSGSATSHAPYQYPHERQHVVATARDDSAMSDGDNDNDDDVAAPMIDSLGPPPMAPPAFTVENSLMGGGIELQPVIANVTPSNFDWSTGRPRSGSLPNILEATGTGSSGSANASDSSAPMWKEV